MNIGVVIQARLGSTRLPQKMVLPFYNGESVIELLVNRLKKKIKCKLIVATSLNKKDNLIEELSNRLNILCYRGDESDVLSRFIGAASFYGINKVIRICADNPFLDLDSLEYLINEFDVSDCDYMSFITMQNIPSIKTHYGFWAEAVKLEALIKVLNSTDDSLYHEHVTNYIYSNPDMFKLKMIPIPSYLDRLKDIRLTLDTLEDFEIQKDIYSNVLNLYNEINIKNVISILEKNPLYFEAMKVQISKNTK
jgi:Spore coat polysaccharide biosynthesis protein F, CMP-KDO synthetase homolog